MGDRNLHAVLLSILGTILAARGSTCLADQSVAIVALDGIPIAASPPWVQSAQFPLEWAAVDSDCNFGVDELDVWVDGAFYNSFVMDGGYSGTVPLDRNYFETPKCDHTIAVRAYMKNPQACTSSTQVNSTAHEFWTSSQKECSGGQNGCRSTSIGGPIDVTTGEMFYQATDLEIPGPLLTCEG